MQLLNCANGNLTSRSNAFLAAQRSIWLEGKGSGTLSGLHLTSVGSRSQVV